jgi:hypothetical protein
MATIVDTHVLWQVVVVAFAAGIGITALFGLVIYGTTRFDDVRRDRSTGAAAVYGAIAVVGLAGFVAAVVYGLVVMTSK